MSRDHSQIFEQLHELDGAMRAMKIVLLHQISECDSTLRHHAECLANSLDRVIADLSDIPPNERLREELRDYRKRIGNMAAANRQ
jgi:hypothetical protein